MEIVNPAEKKLRRKNKCPQKKLFRSKKHRSVALSCWKKFTTMKLI